MDIILVPGLWLDGSSWERVVPTLERAGHRTHPLTLPGMESKDADRSRVTLRDQVSAVVGAIDARGAGGRVVLVAHSAGCGIAHAAVDARPDRVARAVYVGGFPTGDGDAIADGFRVEHGEVPLPDWSDFEEGDLADLDDEGRRAFRRRAIPSPGHLTGDPQQLSDERRYDVPVTVIATEFTSELLQGWVEQGLAPVRELARIRDVTWVDLPAGHWPQFTRPEELARAILAATADATTAPIGLRQFHAPDHGHARLLRDQRARVEDEDLIDPRDRGSSLWFQQVDAPHPQRNRVHLDVWVSHDRAEARVAAAPAAGGRLATDQHAPSRWVLADTEGNEACVATWQSRD